MYILATYSFVCKSSSDERSLAPVSSWKLPVVPDECADVGVVGDRILQNEEAVTANRNVSVDEFIWLHVPSPLCYTMSRYASGGSDNGSTSGCQ